MGAYLSSPKVDKESFDGGDLTVDPSRYGLSCMQGWRKNMEDSHICYSNLKIQEIGESISIYGVFDGHGGPNVSRWISYHFLPIFLKCLNIASEHLEKLKFDKNGEYYKLQLIKLSLEETFLKLDEEMRLRENQEKLKKYSAPQQKGDDELENRDNYIYSILNDIVSKNISIKAIEKDGKRCLQVVYNKDENALEEDVEGNENEQEQNSVAAVVEEIGNKDSKNNTMCTTLPNETEDQKDSIMKEGELISETKSEGKTVIDDITSKVPKESTTISAFDNGKESIKIEETESNKTSEDPKIEVGQKGAIFEVILEKVVDSATEKKEANKENVETSSDKGKEENKNSIAKRLKKDEDAEGEIKKKEESSFPGDHENKERSTAHGKEEMEKAIEVRKETEETVATANDKSEHVKSDLTFENLKYKEEQEKEKAELTVFNEINEADGVLANPNGSLLLNSEETGYYEEQNDKQISIDEVLDSGDFRPFLEELEDTDEDVVENADDQESGENIAYSCGSTAIVAVILKGYLLVANAGDSRAIVCFNGNSLGMSTDHKPHLEEEEMRIKRAGGYITNGRVDGNLNLTRAIGDLHYKSDPFLPQKDQKISAFPDIKCVTLTPEDEFLFLACDGIWDCKEGQEVVSFVKSRLNKFVEKKNDKVNSNESNIDKEKNDSKDLGKSEKEDEIIKTAQEKENKDENKFKNENEERQNESDIANLEQKTVDEKSSLPVVTNKYQTFDKLSQICEELCDDCLSSNCRDNDGIGCDNMTCLIVQYNPVYKSQTEKKFLDLDELLTAEKFNSN